MKVGLYDHSAVCVSLFLSYQILNAEPVFMNLGMYIVMVQG
jgi:hypothetical protein